MKKIISLLLAVAMVMSFCVMAAAADVFAFANDQLGSLIEANAIARLGGTTLEQIQADNSEAMIASVTSGEGVYGVPFTGNTWFIPGSSASAPAR